MKTSQALSSSSNSSLPAELTALRAENAKLRAVLAKIGEGDVMSTDPISRDDWTHAECVETYQRIARNALKGADRD